jgi:hypothetical protein
MEAVHCTLFLHNGRKAEELLVCLKQVLTAHLFATWGLVM